MSQESCAFGLTELGSTEPTQRGAHLTIAPGCGDNVSPPPSALRSPLEPSCFFRRTTMLDPRALTQAQLAEMVADVQAILWQESHMRRRSPAVRPVLEPRQGMGRRDRGRDRRLARRPEAA